MITIIHTDDDRILVTDKHTKKDLEEVIEKAIDDGVEINDIDVAIENSENRDSYMIIGTRVDFDVE